MLYAVRSSTLHLLYIAVFAFVHSKGLMPMFNCDSRGRTTPLSYQVSIGQAPTNYNSQYSCRRSLFLTFEVLIPIDVLASKRQRAVPVSDVGGDCCDAEISLLVAS